MNIIDRILWTIFILIARRYFDTIDVELDDNGNLKSMEMKGEL